MLLVEFRQAWPAMPKFVKRASYSGVYDQIEISSKWKINQILREQKFFLIVWYIQKFHVVD